MKRTTLVPASSLNRLLQSAEEAWQRKDFPKAIETLERASRLAPSNPAILLQLGRFQGLRYNYAAAERCFEQALRVAPRKTEMLTAIADHCHNFRSQDLAARYLQRATEQLDATPLVCLKLAELFERLRRLPEAAEFAERALKLNPAYPLTQLFLARQERLAGRLTAAEQKLRLLTSPANPDPWTRANAWYELGSLLDRDEKYNEAMKALLEAKSILHAQAARTFGGPKNIHVGIKSITSNISAEMLRRWPENGPALAPAKRTALLCGYARSGTTLLEQVLDAHPDIVSAEETDVFIDDACPSLNLHFPLDTQFLDVLEAAHVPVLQQARTNYFHAMDLCIGSPVGDRLLLDKNPLFTFLIPAFVRILPETKFLIALRDPRDIVLSRFFQALPLTPLSAAFLSLDNTVEDYIVYMNLWQKLETILPAPYLKVRYEDVVDDLESVARRTLDFLGVPWDDRVLGFDVHARKKMVRTNYTDVAQPVYKRARGRWRNYQKYLEPHLDKLEPFVKAFGYE
jgi:tetratricopeptide (TPR) repeat protein